MKKLVLLETLELTYQNVSQDDRLYTVDLYLLSYNNNKNLIDTPSVVKQNLKQYLNQYRMITDQISFYNGYVINFGVAFDSYRGPTFISGLKENNIAGDGRNIDLNVNTSQNNRRFSFGLLEPYIFNKNLDFIYNIAYSEDNRTDSASYELNEFNSSIGLRYLLAEKLKNSITSKTKWLILNSPSNPTGSCYSENEIRSLAKVLMDNKQVYILSDDIYEHITYDKFKFFTIAQINELKGRTLTMNGVSKSYAMTGWRIGYAGGPKEIIKAIRKIQSQSTSNPSSVSQAAAVEALNGTQKFIKKRSNAFKQRRDFVVKSLNKISGISCLKPNGAFYVFPNCKKLLGKKTKLKNDSDFVKKLLEKSNVAVVQGSAFGLDGYFRISYATSMKKLKVAMKRIKSFCEKIS